MRSVLDSTDFLLACRASETWLGWYNSGGLRPMAILSSDQPFDFSMAKPPSKPTRHQRTRKDHSTETAEDYVEAVAELIDTTSQCRLVDLAKYFGVSHVTANRIVARLAKEGLLRTEPYKPIELTPAGRRLAKSCQQRHEIVRAFLVALGLDSATADIDSEGIEHHVSPKTVELFQRFVERAQAKQV